MLNCLLVVEVTGVAKHSALMQAQACSKSCLRDEGSTTGQKQVIGASYLLISLTAAAQFVM